MPSPTQSPNRVFGAYDSSAAQQLVHDRFQRSSLELLAVLRVLHGHGLSHLEHAERLLRSLSSDQFSQVWSAPDAYLWTRLAYGFVREGLNDSLVAKFAQWAGLDAEHFGRGLAERLTRIALSGQALAGKEVLLDAPVPLPRVGSMAGTAIAWAIPEDLEVFGTANGRLLAGMSTERAMPLDAQNFCGVLRMPEVHDAGIKIDIWSECVRLDFPGVEQNPRINDLSALREQSEIFARAVALIRDSAAPAYDEVVLILRSAVPLIGDGRSLPSSSNSAITGVMWYTQTKIPELLAEMIIHECGHSKVFLLQDVDPLIDCEVHGSGWEGATYYSPWRDDPRPLNGILHGYIVFSEAAFFWARCLKIHLPIDRDLATRRYGMLVRQIELARRVLERHCRFTALGRIVMDYFGDQIEDLLLPLTLQWRTDHLAELHLERRTQFEPGAAQTISASVVAHRKRWETRYGPAL